MQVILPVGSLRPLQAQHDLREQQRDLETSGVPARVASGQAVWPQGGRASESPSVRRAYVPCAVVLRTVGQDGLFVFPLGGTREVTTTCSPPRIPLRPNPPSAMAR